MSSWRDVRSVSLTRIYTKGGDDGTTGLIGGVRVPKDSPRIEAYGSVDELNAVLGVVRSYSLPGPLDKILERIQDDLFTVGADLALPQDASRADWGIPTLPEEAVQILEKEIDECESNLEPLRQFILPGGTPAAAMLHLARTIARRAERCCVTLARAEHVDPLIVRYLNRLSDLCFVLARFMNCQEAKPESHPTFGKR
jgi:cob(I)alamin adenosyltransferase